MKSIDWKTVAICLGLVVAEHFYSRGEVMGDAMKVQVESMIETEDNVADCDEVKACLRK